jgi:hypothetical protein
MITFFTTAKPFSGHNGITQRNALKSWTLLHPDVQVILFGDEDGAADVCDELGIQHQPCIERSHLNRRLPVANYLFDRAHALARHSWLCYLNCDIILTPDFCEAAHRLTQWRKSFLMVGRRWDLDINAPLDFSRPNWAADLRQEALRLGTMRMNELDYFLFAKEMYQDIPPLIIGRVFWDFWMVWKVRSVGLPVVEASPRVIVVHQNHETAYLQETSAGQGTFLDPGAEWNYRLANCGKNFGNYSDCTHRLTRSGLLLPTFWRKERDKLKAFLWKTLIHDTYWLRKRLGLRRRKHELTQ